MSKRRSVERVWEFALDSIALEEFSDLEAALKDAVKWVGYGMSDEEKAGLLLSAAFSEEAA